jgi:hypothetical protein
MTDRDRSGARAVYGCPPAPHCENCGRKVGSRAVYAGPFCSPMCRDTAPEKRGCGIPNCAVCSGAMRERAGRGARG